MYKPKNPVRIVTAASLFDGHDASINIMRRIIQAAGVEVIHLGHNRSVDDLVTCAIEEDAQAIALTSYQGGHTEYFKHLHDELKRLGAGHIKLFGGGGGVILPQEAAELHAYGITRIYTPDDGRAMGLNGMIDHLVESSDFSICENATIDFAAVKQLHYGAIARAISLIENSETNQWPDEIAAELKENKTPVLGITGTGGAGKSSLVDELARRFVTDFPTKKLAILSVDPTRRKTGGALLGDRIRMNSVNHPNIYMRSVATRGAHQVLSAKAKEMLDLLRLAAFDLVILESSGIGQSDSEIVDVTDVSLYVMTPEFGAATQLEKIDMLDMADLIAVNKIEKTGGEDALRAVKKQYRYNHHETTLKPEDYPVFGTTASKFNDGGVNRLYVALCQQLTQKSKVEFHPDISHYPQPKTDNFIIPPQKSRYLSEITQSVRNYNEWVIRQSEIADKLFALRRSSDILQQSGQQQENNEISKSTQLLTTLINQYSADLAPECKTLIDSWPNKKAAYTQAQNTFTVRGKDITVDNYTLSLSQTPIAKVALPKFTEWGSVLRWSLQENVPGEFPYAAGLFPYKRINEDPTRMFAGEGGPEQTNRRFHYLSKDMPAARLSTAFDSVTLYGADPDKRPDIYGKIGNSGVSVCCLDDAKKLYSGFNLASPTTSVSMTINGPAPFILSFFLNAAIDQQCEIYITANGLEQQINAKIDAIYREQNLERPAYKGALPEGHNGLGLLLLGVTGDQVLPENVYQKIKRDTLAVVRGTVQADILKEDQAQNTCLFSTEFALRLMGDIQAYFIQQKIRNFYSVSISGYHIAEAGANPITQLALTLANGFTYVEYYRHRGMNVNVFAPIFSFFFSNGIDPEYAVIGRVARRIWAKVMRNYYGADDKSQQLKYHIQTSGRSLHAQEIGFNDIRTTLQALYAIYDNCNSLHTNAYDEAITTPTEESVRRAMAIQLIINKELGLAKNENPLQGAFIIEELTDLVEEAVLLEFERISERGGVLGAMETQYQRSKIQEESMYYEHLKHSGEYPVVGVNMFLGADGSPTLIPNNIVRSSAEDKNRQINTVVSCHRNQPSEILKQILSVKKAALEGENTFAALMEAGKRCTLGQLSQAMFEVGGEYRRNV